MSEGVKEKWERAWREPALGVRRWKEKTGQPAIGLLHTDVPEELVLAAGALPVTVLAREVEFQAADKHLQAFACSYSRSVVELDERGELDYLDGLIVPYACDTTRCLDLVLKYAGRHKFHDCLRLPKRDQAAGVTEYFRAELLRVGQNLSRFTGQEASEERLGEAIRQFNRLRAGLSEIRAGLREGRSGFSASDYFSAVRAAMVLPVEESLALLSEARPELSSASRREGVPVVVSGKVPSPPEIISTLEAAGLRMVEDHLVVGGRWVEAQVSESGDPWSALVQRQLSRLPFAGIWDGRPSRASYLLERMRALQVKAAVHLIQKFCEPAELDYPGLRQEVENAGFHLLGLETDYGHSSLEQIKTRVQAFAEMLRANS